ncbi:MAG: ribonuclease HII [Abitibacteriaceae bacterium]|nr:ribonuclease HII [Abditibacteriaceae bacterium]
MARQQKASPTRPTFQREQELTAIGYSRIAGVDEAGRGPLAGPVVAAAVILPFDFDSPHFQHLNDSKQLTPDVRAYLHADLTQSIAFGVGIVDAPTIDTINIRQASWRAMQLAVAQLQESLQQRRIAGEPSQHIDYVLIDGLPYGAGPWPYEAIVKGDARSLSIAAASVIAKVTRDRMMEEFDQEFPQYGFARHKGYPCPQHLAALKQHGPCLLHRRSYAPVREVCEIKAASPPVSQCRSMV